MAHPTWQTVGHKSRIYSLLWRNSWHFQYNAVAIQPRRRHSACRVLVRLRVFAADVRIYNESWYRLTNVINMINILPGAVFFTHARTNILFSVAHRCQSAIQQASRYIYVRYYEFSSKYSSTHKSQMRSGNCGRTSSINAKRTIGWYSGRR